MSRFLIRWSPLWGRWLIIDGENEDREVARFGTLLEAETYTIERNARVEK